MDVVEARDEGLCAGLCAGCWYALCAGCWGADALGKACGRADVNCRWACVLICAWLNLLAGVGAAGLALDTTSGAILRPRLNIRPKFVSFDMLSLTFM